MRDIKGMVLKFIYFLSKISPGGPGDLFPLNIGKPMYPCLLGCVLSTVSAPFRAVGQKGPMNRVCTLAYFYIKPYASHCRSQ